MVGQLWKCLARSNARAIELVIWIIHLVTAKYSFQAALIEGFVMSYEGKSFYQWLNLFPYLWENGCLFGILTC
jgi:hypothetical protein